MWGGVLDREGLSFFFFEFTWGLHNEMDILDVHITTNSCAYPLHFFGASKRHWPTGVFGRVRIVCMYLTTSSELDALLCFLFWNWEIERDYFPL